MRNYVKIQVVKLILTQNGGGALATRYFSATDEDESVETVAMIVQKFQTFANVDLPPTVQPIDVYFKMNQEKIVTMLTANGIDFNEAPSESIWKAKNGISIGNPELSDFILHNFVDKSPRKTEKKVHHG